MSTEPDPQLVREMADSRAVAVARQLRAARLDQGLTQGELADKSGLGVSMLCMWETGRAAPGLRNLTRWAAALGMEIAAVRPDEQAQAERDADVRAVAATLRWIRAEIPPERKLLGAVYSGAWTDLEDRFIDRIAALDARTTDGGATQAARCDSRVHRDFANGQDIRCELPAGHAPHRNGEREWQP